MGTAKLYAYLLLTALFLAGAGGLYLKGRMDSRHAAEVSDLKQELAEANEAAERERSARLQDAIMATEQAKREAAFDLQTEKVTNELTDRDRECLSGADIDSLRSLWGNP